MNKQNSYRKYRRAKGISILELLIALAITAMLMTATAIAFNAAFDSYKLNSDMSSAGTSARNAMYQMCSTIRSAWNDPDIAMIEVNTTGTECSLLDASDRDLIIKYNAVTKAIEINVDAGPNWYTLVTNVEPVPGEPVFEAYEPLDMSFPSGTVGLIRISFQVVSGQSTQVVTSSAIPRNIIYSD